MKKTKSAAVESGRKAPATKKPDTVFPIVGIGASAGGLEALENFFGNMPDDTGMAFVVIQHLDPTHAGIMPELLQRITPMKVFQAADHLKVKPNIVYVLPPNKSISILKGILYLFSPVETRGLRLPIDTFFRSLADDRQGKSIGIILSGMGSDGSLGVKAIKEHHGTVLVQDPTTAKFDGMPGSAIAAVTADIIAAAEDLPGKLIEFLKIKPIHRDSLEIDEKSKSNLDKIIILLREQSGHDFSLYKKSTLFRRIERRKGIHQIDKINHYVRFLQENPQEVEILFKELLIGVTSFFRDPPLWETLREHVLPELMSKLPNGHVMRAWVTGCSTGEEAYSLAIVFKEAMEKIKKHKKLSLQIFATDLDVEAVDKARKGVFPLQIASDVSQQRLLQFFNVEEGGYRVNNLIREMVVFASQNVIKDPPFTKLDLLTCRNLLIYMEPELQHKLMKLFNYSLNPGGIMVLGTSETLGGHSEGFEELDSRMKIFRRAPFTTTSFLVDFPSAFENKKAEMASKKGAVKPIEKISVLADQILLQRFAPASVLVNPKGDIIYITGRTGNYLEPLAGRANWNVYAMAREGLREVLPGAMRKVMQSYDEVHLRKIRIGTNGTKTCVDIIVQRLESPPSIRGMVMIIFKDVPPEIEVVHQGNKSSGRMPATRLLELEADLQRSYEELQNTREEMQTSQEELKSTNEELQSTNEELQSTNEELTTSKEEMQSLNEELQTMNVELQSKVTDFVQANNDMKNLLNSTEIATLFLDKELNIRRFTDPVSQVIKLRNTDIGRPFTDLVTDLQYPEMDSHARKVIKTLLSVETVITTNDGRWFTIRIMPYRTHDDRIDGLVITFNDITVAKKLEFERKGITDTLIISETRYRRLFESAKDGILILDAESGRIIDVNPFLISMLGYSKKQLTEKAIWEIGFFKDIVANRDKFLELQKSEIVRYEGLPLETAAGKRINVEFVSNVYSEDENKVIQCNIRETTKPGMP
jgi:two-component system CheB/CheR fusion protein